MLFNIVCQAGSNLSENLCQPPSAGALGPRRMVLKALNQIGEGPHTLFSTQFSLCLPLTISILSWKNRESPGISTYDYRRITHFQHTSCCANIDCRSYGGQFASFQGLKVRILDTPCKFSVGYGVPILLWTKQIERTRIFTA